MELLHRHREEVSEHQLELVRDAYRFIQAWELRPVRELLSSGVPGGEAAFCVIRASSRTPAGRPTICPVSSSGIACRPTGRSAASRSASSAFTVTPSPWPASTVVAQGQLGGDGVAFPAPLAAARRGLLRVLSPLDAVELRRVA